MKPKLSILIPSIPSRIDTHLSPLVKKLQMQNSNTKCPLDVEILIFTDNKRRSIGMKRDALVQISNGDYIAFVDDDDDISDDYISLILDACNHNADVIVFDQMSSIENGKNLRLVLALNMQMKKLE